MKTKKKKKLKKKCSLKMIWSEIQGKKIRNILGEKINITNITVNITKSILLQRHYLLMNKMYKLKIFFSSNILFILQQKSRDKQNLLFHISYHYLMTKWNVATQTIHSVSKVFHFYTYSYHTFWKLNKNVMCSIYNNLPYRITMYSSQKTCKIQKKKFLKKKPEFPIVLPTRNKHCNHVISSMGTTLCISNNAISQCLLVIWTI